MGAHRFCTIDLPLSGFSVRPAMRSFDSGKAHRLTLLLTALSASVLAARRRAGSRLTTSTIQRCGSSSLGRRHPASRGSPKRTTSGPGQEPRGKSIGSGWAAATGATEPLFDPQKMRAAFDALPELREEDIKTLPNARTLEMNAAHNAALISIGNDLYHYAFGADRAFRLTFDPDAEEEFSFSPDGRQVAFVRRNDLFVVNLEQQRQERQLTTSGTRRPTSSSSMSLGCTADASSTRYKTASSPGWTSTSSPLQVRTPRPSFERRPKAWVDVNGPVRWRPCSLQPRTDTRRATRLL
jgi:hypothetical protein